MKHPTPTRPGWYWAKWRIAEDDTPKELAETLPHDAWTIVEVYANCIDEGDPEYLRVFVSGVAESQLVENFLWGSEIPPALAPNRAKSGAGGEARKSHYGEGEQPWDVIVASGWGPAFAAGCVVRYLRRDKAREHSLESAQWYYARLVEGAAKKGKWNFADWQNAIDRLELILTQAERALARGGEAT